MRWIAILVFISTLFVIAWQMGLQTAPLSGLLALIGVILSALLLIFSLARRLTRMDSDSPWQW